MPRDVVNVVLDRVIDQADLVARAKADAARSKARLRSAVRRLLTASDAEAVRQSFRDAFVGLVLAESSKHAKEAIDNAYASLRSEVRAVRAFGVDRLREIPALKDADVMARRAERKGTDAAPDLSGVDLGSMDTAGFLRFLESLGIRLDPADLEDVADVIFQRIATALRQGVVLAPGAQEALDKGTDAAFDRALELVLKGVGGGARDDVLRRVQAPEIWIAVADGNTCGDCLIRHAEVHPHDVWARMGGPRSAALQCGHRCRCELLPYRGDPDAPDPYVEIEAYL